MGNVRRYELSFTRQELDALFSMLCHTVHYRSDHDDVVREEVRAALREAVRDLKEKK